MAYDDIAQMVEKTAGSSPELDGLTGAMSDFAAQSELARDGVAGLLKSFVDAGDFGSSAVSRLSKAFSELQDICRAVSGDVGRIGDAAKGSFSALGAEMAGASSSAGGLSAAISEIGRQSAAVDRLGAAVSGLSKGLKDASSAAAGKLGEILGDLRRLQSIASKGISIDVGYSAPPKAPSAPRAQSFASGGQVRYTHSNSVTAARGGTFSGRRQGDQEMVFVNGGEGIITAKNIRRGARAFGMSAASYINTLNSPDVSRLKRGRSFAEGTHVPGAGASGVPGTPASSGSGDEIHSDLREITDWLGKIRSLLNDAALDNKTKDELERLRKIVEQSRGSASKKGIIEDAAKKRGSQGMSSELNHINLAIETGDIEGAKREISELTEEINRNVMASRDSEKAIRTWGDAIDRTIDNAEDAVRSLNYEWGAFSSLMMNTLKANNPQMFAMVGLTMKLADELSRTTSPMEQFFEAQSRINKAFQVGATAMRSFADGKSLGVFADKMNLTREQAGQLAESLRKVGVEGNIAFSQVEAIAENIKAQFGQLDTGMLQSAVDLVKDLPKEQIDVMINGKGSLDAQGNLIANLAQSGKLQVAAELITKGAFGEVEGVTPEMSEADKKTLEYQAKVESWMDEMRGVINGLTPSFVRVGTKYVAVGLGMYSTVKRVVGPVAKMSADFAAMRQVMVKSPLPVHDAAAHPSGESATTSSSGDSGTPPESRDEDLGGLKGLKAAAVVAAIGFATKKIADFGSWISEMAEKRMAAQEESRRGAIAMNEAKYGARLDVGSGRGAAGKFADSAQKGFGDTLKLAGTLGTLGTIGAGIGSIVPGVGTAVGAAVGAAAGVIVGSVVGTTKAVVGLWKDTKQALAESKWEKRNRKLIEQLEKNQSAREADMKELGYKVVDMRKSILNAAKHEKAIQMIEQGVHSAEDTQASKYAIDRNKAISMGGGSDVDFIENLRDGMSHANAALTKDLQQVAARRKAIIKELGAGWDGGSGKGGAGVGMDTKAAATTLARLQQTELKAMEKNIQALNENTASIGNMPSALSAAMAASYNEINKGQQRRLVGTADTAAQSGSVVAERQSQAYGQMYKAANESMKKYREMASQAKEAMNTGRQAISDLEKKHIESGNALGLQMSTNADGSVNEEAFEQNRQKLQAAVKRMEEVEASVRGRHSETAMLYQSSQGVISTGDDLQQKKEDIGAMDEDEWNKRYGKNENGQQQLQSGMLDSIDSAMDEAKKMMENMDKGSEEYKNAAKFMSQLQSQRGEVEKLDMDDQKDVTNAMSNIASLIQSMGEQGSIAEKNTLHNDPEFQAFLKTAEGKLVGAADMLNTAYKGYSGAKSMDMAAQQGQEKVLQQLRTKYEDGAKAFEDAMQNIRNSADVMFNDVMAKARQRSLGFDSMTQGGSRATGRLLQSEGAKLLAMRRGMQLSGELVERRQEEGRKFMSENMDVLTGSDPKIAQYYRMMQELGEARVNLTKNPNDEAANLLVDELQAEFEAFNKNNEAAIKKWRKDNEELAKQADQTVGTFNDSAVAQMESVADFKAAVADFGKNAIQRMKEGLAMGYGVENAVAEKELAMSKGAVAAENVDYAGMQRSVDEVAKYSAMERDEKIKNIQEATKTTLAELEKEKQALIANGGTAEDVRAIERRMQITRKQAAAELNKASVEAFEQMGKALEDQSRHITETFGRRSESFEIQEDLMQSIGAPFEMIMDIEQNMVALKREEAAAQEQILRNMIEKGASAKQIEQQKLKTARAQAEVLKTAFGKQRDALDKLIGKMMGTFDQMGGIFGPGGEESIATKYGQGYAMNPAGMVIDAGKESYNSYQERVQTNADIAAGNRMASGHSGFDTGTWDMLHSVAGQKTEEQEVGKQSVGTMIVEHVEGLGGGYAGGGAAGTSDRRDPRDTIPAWLRPGEFVLTPEGLAESARSLGVSSMALAKSINNGTPEDVVNSMREGYASGGNAVAGTRARRTGFRKMLRRRDASWAAQNDAEFMGRQIDREKAAEQARRVKRAAYVRAGGDDLNSSRVDSVNVRQEGVRSADDRQNGARRDDATRFSVDNDQEASKTEKATYRKMSENTDYLKDIRDFLIDAGMVRAIAKAGKLSQKRALEDRRGKEVRGAYPTAAYLANRHGAAVAGRIGRGVSFAARPARWAWDRARRINMPNLKEMDFGKIKKFKTPKVKVSVELVDENGNRIKTPRLLPKKLRAAGRLAGIKYNAWKRNHFGSGPQNLAGQNAVPVEPASKTGGVFGRGAARAPRRAVIKLLGKKNYQRVQDGARRIRSAGRNLPGTAMKAGGVALSYLPAGIDFYKAYQAGRAGDRAEMQRKIFHGVADSVTGTASASAILRPGGGNMMGTLTMLAGAVELVKSGYDGLTASVDELDRHFMETRDMDAMDHLEEIFGSGIDNIVDSLKKIEKAQGFTGKTWAMVSAGLTALSEFTGGGTLMRSANKVGYTLGATVQDYSHASVNEEKTRRRMRMAESQLLKAGREDPNANVKALGVDEMRTFSHFQNTLGDETADDMRRVRGARTAKQVNTKTKSKRFQLLTDYVSNDKYGFRNALNENRKDMDSYEYRHALEEFNWNMQMREMMKEGGYKRKDAKWVRMQDAQNPVSQSEMMEKLARFESKKAHELLEQMQQYEREHKHWWNDPTNDKEYKALQARWQRHEARSQGLRIGANTTVADKNRKDSIREMTAAAERLANDFNEGRRGTYENIQDFGLKRDENGQAVVDKERIRRIHDDKTLRDQIAERRKKQVALERQRRDAMGARGRIGESGEESLKRLEREEMNRRIDRWQQEGYSSREEAIASNQNWAAVNGYVWDETTERFETKENAVRPSSGIPEGMNVSPISEDTRKKRKQTRKNQFVADRLNDMRNTLESEYGMDKDVSEAMIDYIIGSAKEDSAVGKVLVGANGVYGNDEEDPDATYTDDQRKEMRAKARKTLNEYNERLKKAGGQGIDVDQFLKGTIRMGNSFLAGTQASLGAGGGATAGQHQNSQYQNSQLAVARAAGGENVNGMSVVSAGDHGMAMNVSESGVEKSVDDIMKMLRDGVPVIAKNGGVGGGRNSFNTDLWRGTMEAMKNSAEGGAAAEQFYKTAYNDELAELNESRNQAGESLKQNGGFDKWSQKELKQFGLTDWKSMSGGQIMGALEEVTRTRFGGDYAAMTKEFSGNSGGFFGKGMFTPYVEKALQDSAMGNGVDAQEQIASRAGAKADALMEDWSATQAQRMMNMGYNPIFSGGYSSVLTNATNGMTASEMQLLNEETHRQVVQQSYGAGGSEESGREGQAVVKVKFEFDRSGAGQMIKELMEQQITVALKNQRGVLPA